MRTAKVDTTPPDYEKGVLDALAKSGIDAADIAFFAHGTTVVINALTERKGVVTGLITTEGFRDVLEIARGDRPDFFNSLYEKPPAFVPRYLRRELPGRMSYAGEERAPLDLSGLPAILGDFRREGVQAIAVCLLHGYADPSHEQRVVAEIGRLWPEIAVVASHQITREWREYERSSTTVLSAYVQPIAGRYLERLEAGLAGRGFAGQVYVMQSNCGIDSLAATRRIPITMVESGPASGVWGAAELGRIIGEPNVLALDIGGTTAKCSLIENGHVKIMTDYWIERSRRSSGYPIMVPVVDLVEIGNGGGSIAWVDDFGKLHVGPRSAGAVPGPAGYGRGGSEATTTDANLALGRIDKDYFCGGTITADMEAVERALDAVAMKLGVDRIEAARGIVRIADANMVNALKLVSLNRGYDPRDFTLVAFGGGGGMHARIPGAGARHRQGRRAARRVGVLGLGHDDVGSPSRLFRHPADRRGRAGSSTHWAPSSRRPRRRRGPVRRGRHSGGEGRPGAVHQVPLPEPGTLGRGPVSRCRGQRHDARDADREVPRRLQARIHLPARCAGRDRRAASRRLGRGRQARAHELPVTGATLDAARKGRRNVDYALSGIHAADIYDADRLEPGMRFAGPAIVEDPGMTVVVHPGNPVSVDAYGNLHIEVSG